MCPFEYAGTPLLTAPLLWIGETSPFLGPPVRPLGPEFATALVGCSTSFCRALLSSTRGLGLRLPSSSSAWDRISICRSVSRRVLFRPRKPPRWGSAYLKEGSDLFCFVLFCFVYDYGLWSEDPFRDCLMAPNQSGSTSIGLASGRVIPLKTSPTVANTQLERPLSV